MSWRQDTAQRKWNDHLPELGRLSLRRGGHWVYQSQNSTCGRRRTWTWRGSEQTLNMLVGCLNTDLAGDFLPLLLFCLRGLEESNSPQSACESPDRLSTRCTYYTTMIEDKPFLGKAGEGYLLYFKSEVAQDDFHNAVFAGRYSFNHALWNRKPELLEDFSWIEIATQLHFNVCYTLTYRSACANSRASVYWSLLGSNCAFQQSLARSDVLPPPPWLDAKQSKVQNGKQLGSHDLPPSLKSRAMFRLGLDNGILSIHAYKCCSSVSSMPLWHQASFCHQYQAIRLSLESNECWKTFHKISVD